MRSTLLNWGGATLGTVPPALLGAALYGPRGVVAGMGVGSLAFGVLGFLLARRTVDRLEARASGPGSESVRGVSPRGTPLPAGDTVPGPVG